ncbi:hypothetical protein PG993_008497 [Apiospora rasikravindrae]|uniref:SnoaL-like domain-containing protein n=1 Tax=Apiospora rasikravindrae TaxID=990691 RepID=A0ABR1T1Z6_9PEZI
MSTFTTTHLAGLTPREAVADVIYRATAAFDLADAALLDSALTEDAVMTLGDRQRFAGRAAIRADCWAPVSRLDTVHVASNVRVRFHSADDNNEEYDAATTKKATVMANFQANHYRAGEGMKPDAKGFITGGTYLLECVRDESDGGLWKARSWVINLTWVLGDPSVMTSGANEGK